MREGQFIDCGRASKKTAVLYTEELVRNILQSSERRGISTKKRNKLDTRKQKYRGGGRMYWVVIRLRDISWLRRPQTPSKSCSSTYSLAWKRCPIITVRGKAMNFCGIKIFPKLTFMLAPCLISIANIKWLKVLHHAKVFCCYMSPLGKASVQESHKRSAVLRHRPAFRPVS